MFRIVELDRKEASVYEAALGERKAWLEERGKGMWKSEHLTVAGMVERYASPRFYGAFEDSDFVGGFVLVEEDLRYWPNAGGSEAFYLHKFVVSPRSAGRGYAGRMLEWVKDYAARRGKDYVRLDYDGSRAYLRAMYLGHGFEDAGTVDIAEGRTLILAECGTSVRRAARRE